MNKHNQKHLTLSNRTYIEQELVQGSSFKSIGEVLHKDPTTISKEVRRYRKQINGKKVSGNCNSCKYWDHCDTRAGNPEVSSCPQSSHCHKQCRHCWREDPRYFCTTYIPFTCDKPDHFPYVCNGCSYESDCRITHYLYHCLCPETL